MHEYNVLKFFSDTTGIICIIENNQICTWGILLFIFLCFVYFQNSESTTLEVYLLITRVSRNAKRKYFMFFILDQTGKAVIIANRELSLTS